MSDAKFARQAVIKGTTKAKQLLYCVVAEPDSEDLQGDVLDSEEIEKMAHRYAAESRFIGDAHRKDADGNVIPADAEMVETFIAPIDFEVDGEKILKGSWVITIRVNDAEMWNNVAAGLIDGVSIGGSGYRTPV